MRNKQHKKNTPIATLIRNYTNKKCGKVSESREEIKWRFNALDWKDQKKILTAFLDSCASDREWAYGKLLDYWDESFLPKVKELWGTNHEYKCSWSVIRYFPLEYITDHIDDFTDERDYYFICLRLAQDKSYVIDRAKLSKIDYLAVLYHSNRSISYDDAIDTLFGVVRDCCQKDACLMRLERLGRGKYPNVITPANFREVNLAFYYVVQLQQYEAAAMFRDWNEMVEEEIYHSQEFNAIDRNNCYSEYDYDNCRSEVAKLYASKMLDDKYKLPTDPTFEEMRETYEKGLEWSRKCREQSDKALMDSVSEFLNPTSDDEGPLPF